MICSICRRRIVFLWLFDGKVTTKDGKHYHKTCLENLSHTKLKEKVE